MQRWILFVLASVSIGACFDPTYGEGSECTTSCPGDLTCVNNRCSRGSQGDGADASIQTIDGAVAVGCPVTYKLNATGSFYRAINTAATQPAAVADCRDDGVNTYLAIPDSLTESNVIDLLVAEDSWLGITDAAAEGLWRTVLDTPQTFLRFAAGQPDGGTLESCAYVTDGSWQDASCTATNAYVCECK